MVTALYDGVGQCCKHYSAKLRKRREKGGGKKGKKKKS